MAPRAKRATEGKTWADPTPDEVEQLEREAAERAATAPLFAEIDADELADIQIHRTEPVEEEGFLGVVPLAFNEENIRARWGGGRFKLILRNTGNKIKGTKHIVISGDPIWTSQAKKQAHYRGKGLTLEDEPRAAPPAPPPGIGITEITGIFTTMMQMQAAADDRRARETAAADERRAREQDARDERRRKEEQESREREREHTTQMLLLIKESVRGGGGGGDQGAGPALLEAFTSGMKSAVAMLPAVQPAPAGGRGGDGDDDDDDDERRDDPVASAIQGIARVVVDRFGPGGPAPAVAAPAAAGKPADEGVTLVGPLGEKVAALANAAKAANMDVTALLAQGIDNIHAYVARKGSAPALAAVAPPPPFVPDQPLPPAPLNPLAAAAAALQAEQRNGTSSATAS
jgi:hypothetical protein